MKNNNDLIFALDIGTRTIVGLLLEPTNDKFTIKASEVVEHNKRSMLDGQIHNVMEVAKEVKKIKEKLEKSYDIKLKKAGIAAAGRALKTVQAHYEVEFSGKKEITSEEVKVLEFGAVQKAQQKLKETNKYEASGYHFVGYTVLQNKLDGIKVSNLIGQSGIQIEVDVVATFLPRIVVDSLLTVIREADLEVEHLTLEPIAASKITIPRQMHNFNLALVDIGAGTSDIAITKEGSITGYAMVPVAGDEITEAICDYYMVDYHTGEDIKKELTKKDKIEVRNILDQTTTLATAEITRNIKESVDKLAKLISKEILDLNNGQPQAVMCMGGGSLTPLLKSKLSARLDLPKARIGIKDAENIEEIVGKIEGLSGSQAITPVGIAVSCYQNLNRANFLEVEVNGDLIHLFTLTEPKVADALLAAQIDISNLEASPGMALTVEVEGRVKVIKGTMGTPGQIKINGQEADIDTTIKNGDKLTVKLGEKGAVGEGTVADVVPDFPTREVKFNQEKVIVKPQYYMNGKEVTLDTELKDRAQISYQIPQTIQEIITEVLDLDLNSMKSKQLVYTFNGREKEHTYQNYKLLLNDQVVDFDTEINDGDQIVFSEVESSPLQIKDVLAQNLINNQLTITFNQREIEVPAKDYKLTKNNQKTSQDEYVENGDNIEYRTSGIRLNQLLEHINYKLSDTLLQGDLVIEKNDQPAKLTELLTDGDQVNIYVSKRK
ncbi:actin-like ATPase involved in cell division [Halobacteroides halobius DSM 5150]|uniref:Actin-like ATPase involved in cell division n=1 Tax=Halobacteroides halobius (strain ATCC 35273 / DSM 5150 / MD-1) TaxID=748449 RepID=L0K7A5_HALHC|nr:cell division FtsA domain-containing protein [Halobacteroides halobius]AGB41167.1 actin-like ATPase involved in cell division [Halobacteroides halobius DSM 5150]